MTEKLFGAPIDEAMRLLGHRSAAVAVESSLRTDGPDAGTRRIRIVNGDLDVELLPDRGLDIGQVRVAGVPLAWTSPTGFPRPSAGGADARSWLRAFGGGLLTTCGLLSYGAASVDEGEAHPLHGRYSTLSAQVVRADVDDDGVVVEAVVREATVFGEHLELRRRITSATGSRALRIEDVIRNLGAAPVEPMVLYHLNLGWPLLGEGAVLRSPAVSVQPRDAEAAAGLDSWARFPAAAPAYPEQVFRHELPTDAHVAVSLAGGLGLEVTVAFDTAALPALFQWRVAEERGHVVLGIEPATAPTILGRADARAHGMLRPLAPGAELALGVTVSVAQR